MWNSLLDALGSLLAFFYAGIPNYGVGIILLTVSIRLLLYPLTAKQAKSMAAMQRVQPEIKKLQQKYKNDRQKLNEELMAFYKEHQINPLSGCLPILAQIPIFFALFQVLRNPARHIPDGSSLFGAFCPSAATAAECTQPVGLEFLWMDLSRGATAEHGSFIAAFPFWILVLAVVASGYLQSRQMARLQKGRTTPQMQLMTKIFPVMFGVISITLPAGVVLYFLVSNFWQIGQQAIVFGREGERMDARIAADKAKKAKAKATPNPAAPPDDGEEQGGDSAGADATPPSADGESGETERAAATAQIRPARPNRSKSRKRKKRKRRR